MAFIARSIDSNRQTILNYKFFLKLLYLQSSSGTKMMIYMKLAQLKEDGKASDATTL